MMIHFDCPHCAKPIRLAEELAGRRGKCPHCKAPIQAPAAPAAPSPASELFEDVEDPQPAIIRRGASSAKAKGKGATNPMPFVIGGAAVGGVLIVAVVIWLLVGKSGSPAAKPAAGAGAAVPVAPKPGGAVPAPPSAPKPAAPVAATSSSPQLLRYLPADLEALAWVGVAESLKAKDAEHVEAQLKSALGSILLETGLELKQMEQVAIGSGATVEQLLIAVRTLQPMDSAAVRKSLGSDGPPSKLANLDAYPVPTAGQGGEAVVCFPDPHLTIMGNKNLVQRSIEAGPSGKPPAALAAVKEQTGLKTHLCVVANMDLLRMQATHFADLGVDESTLAGAVGRIRQLAVAYDLTHGIQLRAALECASDSESRSVQGTAETLRKGMLALEQKAATIRASLSQGQPAAPSGSSQRSGGTGSGASVPAPGAAAGPSAGPPGGAAGPPRGATGGPGGAAGMPPGGPGPGGVGKAGDRTAAGSFWEAVQIRQAGNQVLVTWPIAKLENERAASPLDLFGAVAQASFARTAVGSALFPGSLRRSTAAVYGIEQKEGAFPTGTVAVQKITRPIHRISWMAGLLPYLGWQELHDQIHFNEEWSHEKNLPVAFTIVEAFLDPNVPQRRSQGMRFQGLALTHFVGMAGVGPEAPRLPKEHPKAGTFGYDRNTARSDIRDGTSNTIMMIQARDVFGPWLSGGGGTVRPAQSPPYIDVIGGFGSPGSKPGVWTVFADGSVRFLNKDIDNSVFEALCTINGGEPVDVTKLTVAGQPAK